MLQKYNSKKEEGFTIIETLIVLAIAGLIILIVLLAVPALQRTSRNTNLKNDATAIAGAINEYESNNGGSTPTTTMLPSTTDSGNTYLVNNTSQAKIQSGDIITSGSATGQLPTATATNGSIYIDVGQTCAATGGAKNNRAVAVYYIVENASGNSGWTAGNCIDT